MSFRRRLKGKQPPDGWDLIEDTIEDFEAQMRDAVSEEHEGKRKNELTWRIHRIHWEKNILKVFPKSLLLVVIKMDW